jgi:small GTP-binding protein
LHSESASIVSETPIVAIVGRPNVGKSALFNRLVGKRIAIVEPTPGVTRDRLYGLVEWNDSAFTLVDTGGIEVGKVDDLAAQTRAQARMAIDEAALIIFVVDAKTGVMSQDIDVADVLRPYRDRVLLVANKVESPATAASIYEFCSLGFDVPLAVSSIHGLQSGDLLDAIVARLPPPGPPPAEATPPCASRLSASPTSASRHWSTHCSDSSARWSQRLPEQRVTPRTRSKTSKAGVLSSSTLPASASTSGGVQRSNTSARCARSQRSGAATSLSWSST